MRSDTISPSQTNLRNDNTFMKCPVCKTQLKRKNAIKHALYYCQNKTSQNRVKSSVLNDSQNDSNFLKENFPFPLRGSQHSASSNNCGSHYMVSQQPHRSSFDERPKALLEAAQLANVNRGNYSRILQEPFSSSSFLRFSENAKDLSVHHRFKNSSYGDERCRSTTHPLSQSQRSSILHRRKFFRARTGALRTSHRRKRRPDDLEVEHRIKQRRWDNRNWETYYDWDVRQQQVGTFDFVNDTESTRVTTSSSEEDNRVFPSNSCSSRYPSSARHSMAWPFSNHFKKRRANVSLMKTHQNHSFKSYCQNLRQTHESVFPPSESLKEEDGPATFIGQGLHHNRSTRYGHFHNPCKVIPLEYIYSKKNFDCQHVGDLDTNTRRTPSQRVEARSVSESRNPAPSESRRKSFRYRSNTGDIKTRQSPKKLLGSSLIPLLTLPSATERQANELRVELLRPSTPILLNEKLSKDDRPSELWNNLMNNNITDTSRNQNSWNNIWQEPVPSCYAHLNEHQSCMIPSVPSLSCCHFSDQFQSWYHTPQKERYFDTGFDNAQSFCDHSKIAPMPSGSCQLLSAVSSLPHSSLSQVILQPISILPNQLTVQPQIVVPSQYSPFSRNTAQLTSPECTPQHQTSWNLVPEITGHPSNQMINSQICLQQNVTQSSQSQPILLPSAGIEQSILATYDQRNMRSLGKSSANSIGMGPSCVDFPINTLVTTHNPSNYLASQMIPHPVGQPEPSWRMLEKPAIESTDANINATAGNSVQMLSVAVKGVPQESDKKQVDDFSLFSESTDEIKAAGKQCSAETEANGTKFKKSNQHLKSVAPSRKLNKKLTVHESHETNMLRTTKAPCQNDKDKLQDAARGETIPYTRLTHKCNSAVKGRSESPKVLRKEKPTRSSSLRSAQHARINAICQRLERPIENTLNRRQPIKEERPWHTSLRYDQEEIKGNLTLSKTDSATSSSKSPLRNVRSFSRSVANHLKSSHDRKTKRFDLQGNLGATEGDLHKIDFTKTIKEGECLESFQKTEPPHLSPLNPEFSKQDVEGKCSSSDSQSKENINREINKTDRETDNAKTLEYRRHSVKEPLEENENIVDVKKITTFGGINISDVDSNHFTTTTIPSSSSTQMYKLQTLPTPPKPLLFGPTDPVYLTCRSNCPADTIDINFKMPNSKASFVSNQACYKVPQLIHFPYSTSEDSTIFQHSPSPYQSPPPIPKVIHSDPIHCAAPTISTTTSSTDGIAMARGNSLFYQSQKTKSIEDLKAVAYPLRYYNTFAQVTTENLNTAWSSSRDLTMNIIENKDVKNILELENHVTLPLSESSEKCCIQSAIIRQPDLLNVTNENPEIILPIPKTMAKFHGRSEQPGIIENNSATKPTQYEISACKRILQDEILEVERNGNINAPINMLYHDSTIGPSRGSKTLNFQKPEQIAGIDQGSNSVKTLSRNAGKHGELKQQSGPPGLLNDLPHQFKNKEIFLGRKFFETPGCFAVNRRSRGSGCLKNELKQKSNPPTNRETALRSNTSPVLNLNQRDQSFDPLVGLQHHTFNHPHKRKHLNEDENTQRSLLQAIRGLFVSNSKEETFTKETDTRSQINRSKSPQFEVIPLGPFSRDRAKATAELAGRGTIHKLPWGKRQN